MITQVCELTAIKCDSQVWSFMCSRSHVQVRVQKAVGRSFFFFSSRKEFIEAYIISHMASFEISATIGYSLVLCGIVSIVLCYNFRSILIALQRTIRKPLLKHLSYSPAVYSLRFKLQWSRAEVLAELAYLGFSIFCVCFKSHNLESSGRRAANMCIGNLIFLYITPHLDALTNTLGLRWRTVRRAHGSFGIMAILLLVFHIVAFVLSKASFSMNVAENKSAVVVSHRSFQQKAWIIDILLSGSSFHGMLLNRLHTCHQIEVV